VSELTGEIEYLEPALAEHRESGSFSDYIGAEAAQRGWERAHMQLRAGVAIADVIAHATAEGDKELLGGLELKCSGLPSLDGRREAR